MTLTGSACAATAEHLRNGPQQDFAVEAKRPVVDVLEIELHPGLEIDLVAAVHGPKAGQTRPHPQAAPLPALILRDFARDRRPQTHERHLPAQHVHQLRQLIEGEAAQVAPDRGQPRIVGNLRRGLPATQMHEFRLALLGIERHGAEFVNAKPATVESATLLREQGSVGNLRPGNTVTVTVQVASPLTLGAGWVATLLPGIGAVNGTDYTANSFEATFVIPPTSTGPVTLTPSIVDASSNPYLGLRGNSLRL